MLCFGTRYCIFLDLVSELDRSGIERFACHSEGRVRLKLTHSLTLAGRTGEVGYVLIMYVELK